MEYLVKRTVFRNVFAIIIWMSTIILFTLHGANIIQLPEMVIGSLITINTLVTQFYFRKKPREEGKA